MNNHAFNGLILAGGQSHRMGYDKNTVNFHGKSQLEYLFELLSKHCTKTYTSCKKENNTPSQFNPLIDKHEIKSPLNGILTALQTDPHSAWISIPVDMPFIDNNIVSFLIKNRNPQKVATCFLDSTGKNPEPLFTIWEPTAYPLLLEFYQKGKISPRDFLKQADVSMINTPDSKYLTNINTPEELLKYRKNFTV